MSISYWTLPTTKNTTIKFKEDYYIKYNYKQKMANIKAEDLKLKIKNAEMLTLQRIEFEDALGVEGFKEFIIITGQAENNGKTIQVKLTVDLYNQNSIEIEPIEKIEQEKIQISYKNKQIQEILQKKIKNFRFLSMNLQKHKDHIHKILSGTKVSFNTENFNFENPQYEINGKPKKYLILDSSLNLKEINKSELNNSVIENSIAITTIPTLKIKINNGIKTKEEKLILLINKNLERYLKEN